MKCGNRIDFSCKIVRFTKRFQRRILEIDEPEIRIATMAARLPTIWTKCAIRIEDIP